MPSKISDSISRALVDNRISIREMEGLIKEAKAQPLTPETKADLQKLLDLNADKFGVTAKRDLQSFLSTAKVTLNPSAPSGPTTPTTPTVPSAPVSIADPAVLNKHTDLTWKPVQGGKLFVDGVNFDDVVQGSIGNCYMVSAFSAIAEQHPEAIENAIKDNGNGTYTVRFFEGSGYSSTKPVSITIDGDLPTSTMGSAKYGKARDKSELWVGLLEKAYAQWKGGYEAIGNGGNSGTVFTAITGKPSNYYNTTSNSADAIFSTLSRATASKQPVTAGTYGEDQAAMYQGTGLYAWHAYTVLSTGTENGQKYVELRNPWGSHDGGTKSDGKDDGIFKLPLADFMKLYSSVNIGG